ncbi:MAG: hypothetical protein GY946_04955 [bacterium]|nr:hypothetical protein [bacterium]
MSGTVIISGYRARQENEILRSAYIQSEADRERSITNFHRVRLGVRDGQYTSWIGTWDQSSNKLDGGSPLRILDAQRVGMRLVKGHQIVAEVKAVGSPTPINDSVIDLDIERVGSVRGRETPPVQSGTDQLSDAVREAIEVIQSQIKSSGLSSFAYPMYLRDAEIEKDQQSQVASDSTTSSKSVTVTGAFVDGDVSITVTLPPGATRARGIVFAQASFDSSVAATLSSLDVAISDGSSDYADGLGGSNGDGEHDNVTAMHLIEVTQDTTYTIRLQSYSNTLTATRQRIVGYWSVV